MYYTYIITCNDNTLYTGICTDLEKRLQQHNGLLKGGAKYTRGRRPVTLSYLESYATKAEAMRREAQIKRLSRKEKEELFY